MNVLVHELVAFGARLYPRSFVARVVCDRDGRAVGIARGRDWKRGRLEPDAELIWQSCLTIQESH